MNSEKKKELLRVIKFTFFSISAGLIQFLVFTLLTELTQWTYWPCYLPSVLLSVLWNFTLNRRFTFQSAANVPVAMLKTLAFYAVFIPLSSILGEYLTEKLLWNDYLVQIINMLLNFVLEFLYQRYVVFRDSLDNRAAPPEQN